MKVVVDEEGVRRGLRLGGKAAVGGGERGEGGGGGREEEEEEEREETDDGCRVFTRRVGGAKLVFRETTESLKTKNAKRRSAIEVAADEEEPEEEAREATV